MGAGYSRTASQGSSLGEYHTAIFGSAILRDRRLCSPNGSQIHDLFLSLLVFTFAAFPGYLLAIFGMDRWGRKWIQIVGFALLAASFVGIALFGDARAILVPFVVLYCLNSFFTEFGPNTTTFVLPAEIFAVSVRTTSHGISATIGKIGAAVGTFSFPLLQAKFGLPGPDVGCGHLLRGRSDRNGRNPTASMVRRRRATAPSPGASRVRPPPNSRRLSARKPCTDGPRRASKEISACLAQPYPRHWCISLEEEIGRD